MIPTDTHFACIEGDTDAQGAMAFYQACHWLISGKNDAFAVWANMNFKRGKVHYQK